MNFRALQVERDGTVSLQELTEGQLPAGEVTVQVSHSTLNYKDALCLSGKGGLVRDFPHVPGIDFAGTVTDSDDARYQVGDAVILTGWGVGERHWGGFSEKARVKADWLVPLPEGLSARHAMAVGTAGLAAMLAIMALEERGLTSAQGEVLVTGATGGVGSIATCLLAQLGYEVVAVTGKEASHVWLTSLGAARILPRAELATASEKPLESAKWAGAIDSVGSTTLARILAQLKYGAAVAAVGLAGGSDLPASVVPFLLRGIQLVGIDSVQQPFEKRVEAWDRLSAVLPRDLLEILIQEATLEELPHLAGEILSGKIQGRVVVTI